MIILIALAFSLFSILFYFHFKADSAYIFRQSFLSAGLFVFLFIAASTELLSFFNAINSTAVPISWALLNAFLGFCVFKKSQERDISLRGISLHFTYACKQLYLQIGLLSSILLGIILTITLVIALVAIPNNSDALSYHLSRIGYWIQNGHVGHYATHIERSISFSPLSEYVHLHLFLLSGTERFFQLVQWLSLVGTLAWVSLLTRLFSASARALRISVLFVATLPIVVLESMTTQNDIVAAFFVLATAFFVFDFFKNPRDSTIYLLAITVGLGMMAKGTFAFYALPFGIYFLVKTISKPVWRKQLGILIVTTGLFTLLLNAPIWYRTYRIFGSPVGTISQGNQTHFDGPADFVSSVSKHLFLHVGTVSPGDRYNQVLLSQLEKLHRAMGIPLDKPQNGMPFKMNKLNFNEDFAHNFFGVWLILFSLPFLFFVKLSSNARWYAALCIASILTFCFFISYQIYGSRLHISFFLLVAPVVGLVYSRILSGFAAKLLVFMLWLFALPFALLSASRPLLSTKWFFEEVFPPLNSGLHLNINIGPNAVHLKKESVLSMPDDQMLWGDQLAEINALKQFVESRNPVSIGLDLEEYSYDYAFQYTFRKPGRTFHHIAVRNPSRRLEAPNLQPDLIIAEHFEGQAFTYHGKNYKVGWHGLKRWAYIPAP